MIEVLISIGIISLVLLSLLVYQISMIKNLYDTQLQTIAMTQLLNFSERLLINKNHSQRKAALKYWNKDNTHLLPQGRGDFNEEEDHECKLTIHWFEKQLMAKSILVYC